MIRLLVADDHELILDGFTSILRDADDISLVGTAQNGQETLDFIDEHNIDVLIVDISMPVLNGVEVCKKLSKTHPAIHVIALSMHKKQSYILRMIQYGAKGYLLKDDSADEIKQAIRTVVQGGTYFSSQIQLNLLDFQQKKRNNSLTSISTREEEVLRLIARGFTNIEIAKRIFVSHHTVESHRKNILAKLDAKNTADLVRIAMEKGLI